MLVVEPVRANDVEPLAHLANKTLSERYDPDWLAEHARASTVLVARDVTSNRVVGFAVAEKDRCDAHLLALAVDEQLRGRGIGGALLANVRNEMARAGAMRLDLQVRADDPTLLQYYQRHGFHPEGLQSGVYRDGADSIVMARPL